MPTPSGTLLSREVSIKGLVKFLNELSIDGNVECAIESTGTLTLGEHALIRGEIRTKSVKVRGTVDGNVFVTERCELQAGCTLRGDIEAPRLMVDENAIFVGSAKGGDRQVTPGLTFAPGLWSESSSAASNASNQFAGSARRRFQLQKRNQLFIGVHNETLSASMRVENSGHSPCAASTTEICVYCTKHCARNFTCL
jgi:cytoskeletal protein CcmA (bactofilin family)